MPPLNYSKWDNLDDSDDDEVEAPVGMKTGASQPEAQGQGQEKQTASVLPAFVIQSTSIADKKPTYINVVSSPAVPGGGMSGVANDGGIMANFPYICGDLRTDTDLKSEPCYVIELIVHPETMKRAEKDRQTQMAVIKTAMAVVSEKSIPVQAENWTLCESESLREPSGAFFFAPGRMMQAAASAGAATSTAAASMGDEDLADIDDDDEDSPVE